MPASLTELTKVRGELGVVGEDRQRHLVDLARARAELAVADRQGAPRTERAKIEAKIRDLERTGEGLSLREAELLGRIDRLRRELAETREEDSVEQLDGQVPVLLLPVRIETRFMPGGDELKVRIYPEQIHIDDHEPGLTEGELAVATAYWDARWKATTPEGRAAAWKEVLRVVRPTRARYLAAVTEPSNLDEEGTGTPKLPEDVALRAGPFTRQPTARLLPEQWVVIGYRDGVEVTRRWGEPVTEGLPVGLPPDLDDDGTDTGVPDDQDTLALDESIEWLVDYDKALAAGMAITIPAGEVTGGLAAGFDELVVVGVDWGADPKAAVDLHRRAAPPSRVHRRARRPRHRCPDEQHRRVPLRAGNRPRARRGGLRPGDGGRRTGCGRPGRRRARRQGDAAAWTELRPQGPSTTSRPAR